MARENVSEESSSIAVEAEPSGIAITCPHCESRWTCDHSDSSCPDCGTSFSVRVRDEFALVERGGWTVAVSLSTPNWHGALGDG